MSKRKNGFTLIEMLIVLGIIGALSSALIFAYGRVVKSGERAKLVELVSNARVALAELYRNNDGWPQGIYKAGQQNGYYVMDEAVAKIFGAKGLLNVDYNNGSLRGKDRCGIVDPWAQDVIMKADSGMSGASLLEKSVPSGGTVRDHRLYFAIDQDGDGFVTRQEGAPVERGRATEIVWGAGADGGLSDCSTAANTVQNYNGRKVTNRDNVYSWSRAQEDRK